MEILLLGVVLGLIPAAIARSKGRSFFGFWLYGALIFIVGYPTHFSLSPMLPPLRLSSCPMGTIVSALIAPKS